MARNIGMIVGMIVGVAVGLCIVALLFHKKVFDMTFDERQQLARGKAFQYAFFTLTGALLVYGFSEFLFGRWCDVFTGSMLCFCIAMLVFATICIFKDAYLSLKEKPKTVMITFACIAAFNIAIGAVHIASGNMIMDGILTFRSINLMCGVMMLLIMPVYGFKLLLDGKADAE